VILDIGGEGRHPPAWNVNRSPVQTRGPHKGQPIPRLVLGRADALPFASASTGEIVMERTPLPDAAVREIARVIRPGGRITLRHADVPHRDPHTTAITLIPGNVKRRRLDSGGPVLRETVIQVADLPGRLP